MSQSSRGIENKAQKIGATGGIALAYQSTRLWLVLAAGVVIIITETVTGWERGVWILLAAAPPLVHALIVRRTGGGLTATLFIDCTALGLASLALSLPVVTASAFSFYVVVLVLLADRRAAPWLAFYGLGWGTIGLVSAHFDWFQPFSARTALVLESVALIFFLSAIGAVILRLTSEARRLAAERLEIEKALRSEELRFRTMIENAFDGVGIIGPAGDLVYVSESIERILGYSISQRLGRPMHDIVVEEDVPLVLGELAKLAKDPSSTARVRAGVHHADGSVRILDVVARNMMDEPSVGGIVANFRDVTEQAEIQAALEESNERLADLVRSKDEFVASVSHELRTPLTAVLGLAEELRDHAESFSPEERRDLRDLIALQAREVAAIVEDLLVAARADIGAVTMFPQAYDVARALEEVLVVLKPERPVEVSLVPPSVAFADPTRCRQVVRNLITNALRYGGERVKVAISSMEGFVHLAVQDDGVGLSEEDAGRVFEPYESAHHERTQPASIGLGLTVSRQLARLMGGDLVYRNDGGWSTFELKLPQAP